MPRAQKTKNVLGPTTQIEKDAVENACLWAIQSADNTLNQLATLPKAQRNDWWVKMVAYWKSCRSGFVFLRGNNRKRVVVEATVIDQERTEQVS